MADASAGLNRSLDAELIPDLAAVPDELARLLAGHAIEALKRPTSDGGWGAIENLGHLSDWEEVFHSRVQAVIDKDEPRLPEIDDQLWEIEHEYRAQDPFRVLDQLRGQRRQLVELLAALPGDAWGRKSQIGTRPGWTLAQMVEDIRRHDAEHARAIAEALG